MSEEIKSENTELKSQGGAWDKLVFWKLAIAKVGLKCYVALFGSVAATLNGVQWNEFTSTQKILAIGAAGVAVSAVIDAFLSDTMAKLQGKADDEKEQKEK